MHSRFMHWHHDIWSLGSSAVGVAASGRGGGRLVVRSAVRYVLSLLLLGVFTSGGGCGTQGGSEMRAAEVATAFLKTIRQGEVAAAWQETSTDFKSAMGRDRMKAYVKSESVLRESMTLISESTVELQGRPYHRCVFTPASGKKQVVVLLRAERAGDWKVERLLVED
jgi:hypothetical protein